MKRIIFLLILLMLLCPVWVQAETKKIEGTTNIDDTWLREGSPDYNYGLSVAEYVYGATYFYLIRVKNVATELGVDATITSAICSLYVGFLVETCDISCYRVFKPWIEGSTIGATCPGDDDGATWNDWHCLDYEWATPGCLNTDDEGSDNSGDGTGADRKSTAESTVGISSVDTWYGWTVSNALAQGWYDGTINEEGILFAVSGGAGYLKFCSTEYTTEALRPFWTFTYTTGEPPEEKKNRKRKIVTGE